MRVVLKSIACIAIPSIVMAVIVGLEQAVVLNGPSHFLAHERTQNFGGKFIMVLGRQPIADIVKQCTNHPVDIGTVTMRASRRLHGVLKPRDAVTVQTFIALFAQFIDQTVRNLLMVRLFQLRQQLIVLAGAVLHLREAHLFHAGLSYVCASWLPPI